MNATHKTSLRDFIELVYLPTRCEVNKRDASPSVRHRCRTVVRLLLRALDRHPRVSDLSDAGYAKVFELDVASTTPSMARLFGDYFLALWRCAHQAGILADAPPELGERWRAEEANPETPPRKPRDKGPRGPRGRQKGTLSRHLILTPSLAKFIDDYVRLQAAGTSEAEIQKQLQKSEYQLKHVREVHQSYFAERYAAAMEVVSNEIRSIAGTDRILALPDTYLAAAENADKWHQREHGKPLFSPPEPLEIAGGKAEHTLSSFFESYYRPVCLADAAKETVRLYRLIVRRWVLLTGDPPLSQVTSLTFSKWRDAQSVMKGKVSRKRCASNTVRMHMRHLQAMFDKAGPPDRRNRAGASIITTVPYLKPPKPEYGEPRITTEELVTRCYVGAVAMSWPRAEQYKPPAWWRALLVLVWNTGIRRRTLFSLRMKHVDWQQQRLVIPGEILKAGKMLILPVPATVIEHLQAIRTDRALVFEWPHSQEFFGWCFHKLQNEVGIPPSLHFGLHTLRRTLGTRLWKDNPAAAQLMLGHSTIEITKRHYVNTEDVLGSLRTMQQPAAFVASQQR